MSDAIVLRALQLREHRILELEDENRRLKARAEAAERDRDALVSECNDWQASYGYALARAEAAERKVARLEVLREAYQKVPPPAMVPLAVVVGDLNKAIVGVDDE